MATETTRGIRRRSTAVLAALLTGACASAPSPAVLTTTSPAVPLPEATLRPLTVSQPDADPRPPGLRLLEETRFTLELQDADLAGLLLGLGHDSPFNAVIDPAVTGRVTADFENASVREILDEVLFPRGYHYSVNGRFLRISASGVDTRTYRVDYPNYTRTGNSDLTISGAIASSPDVGAGTSSDAEDSSSTSIRTTQSVDFWSELEAGLRVILFGSPDATDAPSESPHRSVVTARQSGLLTVTAEPNLLRRVEDFLEEVALATHRQVMIDVKILEIDIGDDFEFGVDWEAAADLGSADGVLSRTLKPGFPDAFSVADLAPTLTGGGFLFGVAAEEIGVLLSALASERNVRVVSTPRLATLNNHKALIKVVRNEVFFVAEVKTEAVEGVATTQTTEFVPQIVPVGVTLDITPQISEGGRITMHIHPSISEVVDVVPQPKADATLDSFGSLPVIDLRETDTVMEVEDQDTILIGGLIQSRELNREGKVPLLGDLPLIGQLFRSTRAEESRTELVILVTPTILDGPMVSRVRADATASLDGLDALRETRLHELPWWRTPFFDYYGAEVSQ